MSYKYFRRGEHDPISSGMRKARMILNPKRSKRICPCCGKEWTVINDDRTQCCSKACFLEMKERTKRQFKRKSK